MTYLKKLALVAVLAVASVIWFPVLAVRGVFAVFNWLGAAMKSGMRHKDSGVMLVSFCGVIVFSPVWLLSMGMIIALAAYEVACFKLMNALYQAEDIGFRPSKGEPDPPPQRRVSQEPRPEARVMQLPSAQRTLSEVQAQQVALRSGWNPHELDFTWDSRRQLWRSKDGQLVDHDGGHVAWRVNSSSRVPEFTGARVLLGPQFRGSRWETHMPFKFDPPKHPEFGTEPRGTVETVKGCALFSKENDTYDWDGETDVWWDEQRTVEDKDGRVQLIDHKGNTWWARKIDVK